jgi:predicted TPR repeat methyltransferase
VEADPSAAEAGKKIYDRWICASLAPGISLDRAFDVIVCADVLEHLPRPEELLPTIRGWLTPDGLLLVSLPNIANITSRLSLLAGRFAYADRGILDRTHLRFYTRKTGRRLLEEGGFRIGRIAATAMPAELGAPWLGRFPFRAPVRALLFGAAAAWPTLLGYQFLYEARRT